MRRETDDRLFRPHHAVRRVSAGAGAPWPGELVRLESGESRVLVDAALLSPQWPGWRGVTDGHLLAPLDVVRRPDGHDVSLPYCTGRVAEFFERRRAGRVPLSAGESVTLAVSVLRGLVELGDDPDGAVGEWWLTDAGRPVLAAGVGVAQVRDASLAILDEAAFAQPDPRLWNDVRTGVEQEQPARGLLDLEQRLFAWAVPAPLAEAPLAPRRSTPIEPVSLDRVRRDDASLLPIESRRGGILDHLVRHVDADLADLVSRSTTAVWRRLHARPAVGRGRPWAIAGGVAVAIVLTGVLWPAGTAAPVAADGPSAQETPVSMPAVDQTPSAEQGPAAEQTVPDLAAVTAELLSARTACGGEPDCLARHVLDPAVEYAPGAIDLDVGQRAVTLVDEFGGVAVLRVTPLDGEGHPQLVVIQREEDSWLLRDVYVAQQP